MTNILARKRAKIDALDSRLAVLLAGRFAVVRSLSGLKRTVRDPKREKEVLSRVRGLVKDRTLKQAVSAVYKEIIKQARRIQGPC